MKMNMWIKFIFVVERIFFLGYGLFGKDGEKVKMVYWE